MSIKTKKIAFYISFGISVLIALVKCDRGVPTETVEQLSISGRVTSDGKAEESILVKLEGDAESSTHTDSLGKYLFADLNVGLYGVYPTRYGYEFTPERLQVELTGDLSDLNFSMRKPLPKILLLKNVLEFGEVPVGSVKEMRLGVSNLGRGELLLKQFTINSPVFSVVSGELSVPPDSLKYITIEFAPVSSDTVNVVLSFTTNDPDRQKVDILLTGSGSLKVRASIVIEPLQMDFGTVGLGTSSTLNLIIRNNGGNTLEINSITTTEPDFQVNPDSGKISAGDSMVFKVAFTPKNIPPVSATLNIRSNSGNLPSADVSLRGSGSLERLPGIRISPAEVDFGQVVTDSQSVVMIEISSVGTDSLLVTALEIDNNRFKVSFSPEMLAPGQRRSYQITFKESLRGLYSGTLTVYSSDPESTAVRIPLRAEVITPPPTTMRLNPAQLSFGAIIVGSEIIRFFWVVNPNEVPLIASNISTSSPGDFRVNIDSLLVKPGDSTSVKVTFSPTNVQQYSETVVMTTNVVGSETVNVALTGEGGQPPKPEMALGRTSIDFGSVILQDAATEELTIRNNGLGILTISKMESDHSDFKVETPAGGINPGSSRSVKLSFEPREAGVASATLVIESNDPFQPRAEVSLTGTAVDTTRLTPAILLSTHQLDLGLVILQTSGLSGFVISNLGKKRLEIYQIGTGSAVFGVDKEQATIQPGMEESIKVSFTPANEGLVQGMFQIESNDPVKPVDTLRVQGEGISGSGVIQENEIYIEGGSFLMGQGSGELVREVTISNFYMDAFEVTNAEYKEFIDAGGYDKSEYWTAEGWHWRQTSQQQGYDRGDPKPMGWGSGDAPWESSVFSPLANSPVSGVSWYEAYAYARFRGKSLPTEAQWEYVARGVEGRIYPWGNIWFGDFLNHGKGRSPFYDDTDGFVYAAPVGSYPGGATAEGIHDLSGNVFEWCKDWFAVYTASDFFNPQGPWEGEEKVMRGGSWRGSEEHCRTFQRSRAAPTVRLQEAGFRLVRNN